MKKTKTNTLVHYAAAITVTMLVGSIASAQTLLAEWNFNAATGASNASTGTGTSSGGFYAFTPNQNGSPNDTNPIAGNNASAGRSGPNPLEAPGARSFSVFTSTAGKHTPTITWDLMQGYRASRYYQMVATTDGTSFNPLPTGGTGSSISGPFGTASIDATGLVTIETIDGLINDDLGTGYMYDLSYTFPNGTAYDNNPNFGVRWYATWDPNASDYVSSFAGTDSTDTSSGYIRNTALGGNQIRYDLVRITAIPEPTSFALAAVCGLALAVVRRRK